MPSYRNVNAAFVHEMGKLRDFQRRLDQEQRTHGRETLCDFGVEIQVENSRNGPVYRYMGPYTITYQRPTERVLMIQGRNENPFFHFIEAMWMLAGRNDLASIAWYNPRMAEYSDNGKTLNGAYGYRWRFASYEVPVENRWTAPHTVDQLRILAEHLKSNPTSRRAVLSMWNVEDDLLKIDNSKDVCCNLEAVFQVDQVRNALDLTVFNRSNDIYWGALGANQVHFSFLLEYMALLSGHNIGCYHQVSTNMHMYQERMSNRWRLDYPLWESVYNPHSTLPYWPNQLFCDPQKFHDELDTVFFILDQFHLVHQKLDQLIQELEEYYHECNETYVGKGLIPMILCWEYMQQRQDWLQADFWQRRIQMSDWASACKRYLERMQKDDAAQ